VQSVNSPLLFFLARCSRNELIRQIEFLKAENEMLRKPVPHRCIYLKDEERERLITLGQAIGDKVRHLITIVRPQTYCSWLRKLGNLVPRKRVGRPKTPAEIQKLILRIAEETQWGYTRILGELRKLGYSRISRQTVVNIMKQAGLDPNRRRRPGVWDDFLSKHAQTLWQCDIFSKRILSRIQKLKLAVTVKRTFFEPQNDSAIIGAVWLSPDDTAAVGAVPLRQQFIDTNSWDC
jgi:helix-turn-helix protein